MKTVLAIRLGRSAEQDYRDILHWTNAHFGAQQAQAYARTIGSALVALRAGPSLPGVKRRDDIGPGLYTLHVARSGRKGRHFVMFRLAGAETRPAIDVLRLLHDSMDLPRHTGDGNGEPGDPRS